MSIARNLRDATRPLRRRISRFIAAPPLLRFSHQIAQKYELRSATNTMHRDIRAHKYFMA